jgi:hypothetical protein
MRARSVVPFCLRSFLVGLFLFSVAWTNGSPVARTADDQEEVGVWRCALAKLSSCPPDGEGRGPEDFWTFPMTTASSPEAALPSTLTFAEPRVAL